jgi:hypothetical protein
LRWVLSNSLPVLAILLAGPGCAPRAVDRAAQVSGLDAGGPDTDIVVVPPVTPTDVQPAPPSDAAPPPDTAPPPDAAPPRDARPAAPDLAVSPPPDVAPDRQATPPPPDAVPDTSTDQVGAVLALATSACAMKASKDYPLQNPAPDGGVAETASLCGLKGAVYWVADLDITCDGRNSPGKCDNGHDTDTLVHNSRGQALVSATTPYVVVPAEYAAAGLSRGAVVVVINNATRAMTFAIFGDSSGTAIGAASYACAEKLGLDPQPVTGGVRGKGVTYVAFTGAGAVPGDVENLATTAQLGQMLVSKLLIDNK